EKIAVKTPRSFAAATVDEALAAAEKIGYPIMMRAGYSLGGLGSGRIADAIELRRRANEALHAAPQILIEENLFGWKEIEYEIVRDKADNVITVCNMENMDPMGIHTGESIVVAPSQTLTNTEYHTLREVAIRVARAVGIVGECNIQFALHPKTGDYRVIEMNARLSRSSALASKATGYPLAYVAAKLAVGYRLDELKNAVTKKTSAFFEPALDYLVVKIPRWDIHKLKAADRHIGSEMKSVGEVMAIGRSFPEALQKAVRMLNIGANGLTDYPYAIPDPANEIKHPTDRRLFAIYEYLKYGDRTETVAALSRIDPWFIYHLAAIVEMAGTLRRKPLSAELLRTAKQLGFADAEIAKIKKLTPTQVRARRKQLGITPFVKQIDTLAGEFPAETNYLYCTYHAATHDLSPAKKRPLLVLGSGPYSIGSSVEFDWCAVNTAKTLRQLGEESIIINSNPETVSTDYDESNRLYFEELTLERVADIADFEAAQGLIVSVGGQIPNNLAIRLHESGYRIVGTTPTSIDMAENREKFSSLLHRLDIDQPRWQKATSIERAKRFAREVGYPVLLRPSYVLSGAAMNVIADEASMEQYLRKATTMSPDHPVVISQFISNAKELEIDGVADHGRIVVEAISEHVENAGVHSGDATIVLPPQRLYLETIRRAKQVTAKVAAALNITGPFNIQFIAKDNALQVIECNLRASRSFPFVSKVTNHNFINISIRAMLGRLEKQHYETLELNHVGVKTPQFSYQRLKGADPVAQVEMASTGEVACIGNNYLEAFFTSWLATDSQVRGRRILLSIGGDHKVKLLSAIAQLDAAGWELFATEGTHQYLAEHGIAATFLYKASDALEPSVATAIAERAVDCIINIPRSRETKNNHTDGYAIRRLAIDHHLPLITNVQVAQLFLRALAELDPDDLPVKSWREFLTIND
ncbi:MAG: carbamoyl-phosphate synthase (glutamine-hydrolyzing) large subunit, partial [Candidatus Magasanikbacteria bacterium]|nr:carbamoyl-phosphate synthase (glutamine-hydrolyzing) large subunit [Candidatus Magasanikbacteria bacterium]